ncbi:hypothetical protein KUCAC02_028250 [Chaenocephalus aceratus]|uniref:Uncharacterized protein n=1 Tax=Chaenocephalus aceratus TaxID=36190 RepID=A0ACB9X323_CHAAC|nr:hypothetical protein KUCAC02_028250 [Chaenocephalus aceratus]
MSKTKSKQDKDPSSLSASVTLAELSSLLAEHRKAISADFKSSFEALTTTLDGLNSTVAGHGERIGSLEDNSNEVGRRLQHLENACSTLQQDSVLLKTKLADLEGRSRRQNIRIIGLPESLEGPRPTAFFSQLLVDVFGKEVLSSPPELDRAHRSLASKPAAGDKPRPVIVRLHRFQVKDLLIREARRRGELFYKEHKIRLYEDYISDVLKERAEYKSSMAELYKREVANDADQWITITSANIRPSPLLALFGTQAKDKTRILPNYQVLRENSSAMFCCVPPRGVHITSMSFNHSKYPLMSIGAGVKAITVHNLKIPTKPSNISCVTSDMTSVSCTWDSGRKRDENDRNTQTRTLHIDNSEQPPINCEQSSCTFPAIPNLKEYNIRVVVKDLLGEETESYSFNISDRVSPVVELERVSLGATHTTVSWIVHENLTRLNLLCQVTADPGSATKLRCNSVSGRCKVTLEYLLPNTPYSTRVRCSVDGRLWGEWTKPRSFKTYPLVTLDVWRRMKQLSDPNSRQVTLLWTHDVPDSAATIKGFMVQWSQGSLNWTERKDSGQTQAQVSINLGQYDFTVRALLHSGSAIPAHIIIPQKDIDEILPVKRRLSSSPAGFNLTWDELDTVTCGYTVEWCILGNAVPCNVQWLNSTSSSVTLEWSYNEDDPAHTAFITGYLVTGQEAGTDTLPGHVANLFNVSVVDPRRKSVTIEGLQQDHKYLFSVSALTKGGPGQSTSITIRTNTNYSTHLAKILTPMLLLLGCIIALWPQRKILKSGLREMFAYPAGMNIKTPELDSFLHETGERLQALKVEECSTCDIEILNSRPLLKETSALRDPAPMNPPPSPAPLNLPPSPAPLNPPPTSCSPEPTALSCSPEPTALSCSPEPTALSCSPEPTPTSCSPEPTALSCSPEPTPTSCSPEPTALSCSPEPTALSCSPEPTALSCSPEPTPTSCSPEPTALSCSPEPTALSCSPEPTPLSCSPEPTALSCSPEPTPTSCSPEPTALSCSSEPTALSCSPEPTALSCSPERTAFSCSPVLCSNHISLQCPA